VYYVYHGEFEAWGLTPLLAICFTLVSSPTLKTEATCSSETSVNFKRTIEGYIPEDGTPHQQQFLGKYFWSQGINYDLNVTQNKTRYEISHLPARQSVRTVIQHSTENQRSALCHFSPKVDTDHSSTHMETPTAHNPQWCMCFDKFAIFLPHVKCYLSWAMIYRISANTREVLLRVSSPRHRFLRGRVSKWVTTGYKT
jgi:hypothetical protein